jgi:5'-nucleotidase
MVDPASLTLNGAPIDPAANYRVVANAFLAQGGDNFAAFKSGTNPVSGVIDFDALVTYLGANSLPPALPLAPPASNRITITAGNLCPP